MKVGYMIKINDNVEMDKVYLNQMDAVARLREVYQASVNNATDQDMLSGSFKPVVPSLKEVELVGECSEE